VLSAEPYHYWLVEAGRLPIDFPVEAWTPRPATAAGDEPGQLHRLDDQGEASAASADDSNGTNAAAR
jgi:hypothetical protein